MNAEIEVDLEELKLETLEVLFAAYHNAALGEKTIMAYLLMVQHIDPFELQMTVYQAMAECKFLPSPAELLDIHRQLKGQLAEQTPGEAWGSVEKAMKQQGREKMPGEDFHFKNPITHQVVKMIGWRNLCNSEMIGVERAQFIRMYEDLSKREDRIDRMMPEVKAYFEKNVQRKLEKRLEERSRARLASNPGSNPDEKPGALPSAKSLGDSLRNMGLTG